MSEYTVSSQRGFRGWYQTREDAIRCAERMEREWREIGCEVPHAIYYHGREVLRDEGAHRAELAREECRFRVRMGQLRKVRGGLVAVK